MADFTQDDPRGAILLSWEAYDRPHYERGSFWFAGMSLVGGALLLYAVVTGNFLFALIILMSALVIYLSGIGDPQLVEITLTDLGVGVGDEFFLFREVEKFWFAYEPPEVKNLYIDLKRGIHTRTRISLEDQNPNEVRAVLGRYVHEDLTQEEEPFIEFISRVLKI